MSHDIHTWVVSDNNFLRAELDNYSKRLDSEIIKWLDKYSKQDRERFVLAMFDIFEKANIVSFMDIMENRRLIFKLIDEYKELADIDIKMFRDFIRMLLNSFKDVKLEEFKKLIEK